jgi:hypothetical protein
MRRCGFFVLYVVEVENRLLGGTGVEPTQPRELRFHATLGEEPEVESTLV